MNLLNEFKSITTFVFDVDGVLTDGNIFVFANGEQVRRMSIKDGYALQLAIKKGFRIVVISGSVAEGVKDRLKKLGINDVYLQIENKKRKLEEYMRHHKLNWEEILFMGDDIPDFAVMKKAGISAAPSDAASEIKHIAKYISPCNGGEGCVRDVIEKVLKLNNHWELDLSIASK